MDGPRGAVDFRLLVDQVADQAIIALDPGGTIVSWNVGAEHLSGYSRAETVGQHFSLVSPTDDRDRARLAHMLPLALENGLSRDRGWWTRQDGTEFWGDTVVTAVRDDVAEHVGYALVIQDLTQQHALELSLRRSEQRFRLLVEQVVDYAIIGLDLHGTIETWNSGAERLKGYRADEAVGSHFSMFYTEADREADLPQRLLAEAREHGRTEHSGWRVRRDGTHFWADVTVTAIQDDGALVGFAKVTRDVTARKRFDDARETFFDTFAHDFRGPVTAIAGFAELLDAVTDEERAGYVERIRTNARRLTTMTADLVEHSRVQSSGDDLDLVPLDLEQVVRETVDGVGGDAATDRVRVDVPPLGVLGDRGALERILVNLVSNALRYSAESTTVLVTAEPEGRQVLLTVTDEGRGIDPEDLPGIFDEFARGRLAVDDGGTGLGLTSVKLLAERMGGVVTIASEPGVGTRVTVVLSASRSASPSV